MKQPPRQPPTPRQSLLGTENAVKVTLEECCSDGLGWDTYYHSISTMSWGDVVKMDNLPEGVKRFKESELFSEL